MLKFPHKYADFLSFICSKDGRIRVKENGPKPSAGNTRPGLTIHLRRRRSG